MKFNDYLNKETSSHSVQEGITVRDENREGYLEAQVESLSSQLSKIKDSAKELAILKSTYNTLQAEHSTEMEGKLRAEKDAARAMYQLDTQRRFIDEINGLSKHAELLRESLQAMKLEVDEKERRNLTQLNEITSLTATNTSLTSSQEDLIRKVSAAEQRVESIHVEKISLAEIITGKQVQYDKLSNEKKDIYDKYLSIITQNTYLTAVCARLDDELEMERGKNKSLAESLNIVNESYGRTKYSLTNTSVEAKDLQEQVSSLLKTLTDSNKTNDYLLEKQKYLEEILAKPKYMSTASIARREGFKMSLGSSALNVRKNYLGTGKPTLLKFKEKESTNDN